MKLKSLSMIAASSLILTYSGPVLAEDNGSTKAIAEKYEIGDKISAKDLEVIKQNAHKITEALGTEFLQKDSWSVFGSGRNGTLLEGDLSGNIYVEMNWWNHQAYGNLKTSVVRGNLNEANNELQFIGFGTIGTSGTYVGKTVDWTTASGWTQMSGTSFSSQINKYFSGNIMYYQIYPKGYLRGGGGSLEIAGSGSLM